MTTPIVPSITDEIISELEWAVKEYPSDLRAFINHGHLAGLIARLRAAEADVARLNKLDALCEAYGCEGIHEGNRWTIDGPYRNIRAAVDDIPEHQP